MTANDSILKRAALRRRLARQLLGGKCARCGSEERLHFDHVDPKTKKIGMTDAFRVAGEVAFWTEVLKCQLLCNSCHWEKTREDARDGKVILGRPGKRARFTPKEAREIKRKYTRDGKTLIDLAVEYQCATSTIWRTLRNAR